MGSHRIIGRVRYRVKQDKLQPTLNFAKRQNLSSTAVPTLVSYQLINLSLLQNKFLLVDQWCKWSIKNGEVKRESYFYENTSLPWYQLRSDDTVQKHSLYGFYSTKSNMWWLVDVWLVAIMDIKKTRNV